MEMRLRRTRTRVAILAAGAAAIGASVAYAAIPDGNKVFTACMRKNVGTVRLINTSLPASSFMSHCKAAETRVSWNQQGQAGAPGKDGTNGAPGEDGAPGANGQNGRDGASVTSAAEPVGKNCATGGSSFTAASNVTFACNGAKGDPGEDGSPGPSGTGALWALWKSNGIPPITSSGVAISRLRTGVFAVTFPVDVRGCATSTHTAAYGVSSVSAATDPPASVRSFDVYGDIASTQVLRVGERSDGNLADGPFSISVFC